VLDHAYGGAFCWDADRGGHDVSDSKRRLPAASEDLLSDVAGLRDLERRRREEPISSPAFHDLGREVTAKSHEIMYAATVEEALGNDTEPGDESIDDVEAEEKTG
jgi:hypothetical protein